MGKPLLGAHVSISGGAYLAVGRAEALGVAACQIFVKSPNQWRSPALIEEQIEAFRTCLGDSAIDQIIAHAAYLINLAALDPAVRERSVAALVDELQRAHLLGLDGLVVHPGAHLGAGEPAGLARVARSLDRVLARVPRDAPPILLENTAGQGTVLGCRLEQLAEIFASTSESGRLGICLDTCHAFAAGYAIDESAELDALFERIDTLLGLERLNAIHLNDSRYPLGSRRDRHANIGAGEIGREAFANLLNHPRLPHIPLILETPMGDDGRGHARDLETLRSLTED